MTVGPYLCSAAFVHLLAAAGTKGPVKRPGNIINISSLSGLTKWSQNGQFAYNVGPYPDPPYADTCKCAKAAVIQLSKLMATDLCAEEIGIRVNNLAPGYFSTELTTGTASTNGKSSWPIDEFKAEMKRVHSNADRPGTDTEMGSVRRTFESCRESFADPQPTGHTLPRHQRLRQWPHPPDRRWPSLATPLGLWLPVAVAYSRFDIFAFFSHALSAW